MAGSSPSEGSTRRGVGYGVNVGSPGSESGSAGDGAEGTGTTTTWLGQGPGTRTWAHTQPLPQGVQGTCLGVLWEPSQGNYSNTLKSGWGESALLMFIMKIPAFEPVTHSSFSVAEKNRKLYNLFWRSAIKREKLLPENTYISPLTTERISV